VFDVASEPRLLTIRDPAALGWTPIVQVEHYRIAPETLETAAVGDVG
jgi:hypothetical protein